MRCSSVSEEPAVRSSMTVLAFQNAFAGAAAGASADMIVYGLDSYKVMKQGNRLNFQFSTIFRGIFGSALTGAAPSFGLFFAFYSPTKLLMEECLMRSYSTTAAATDAVDSSGSKNISVLPSMVASLVGGVPASLVAVPADVVKKEMMLKAATNGTHGNSFLNTTRYIARSAGVQGLFTGWRVNLLRDIPFAGIKMTLYDVVTSVYLRYLRPFVISTSNSMGMIAGAGVVADASVDTRNSPLSPMESASVGFASGAVTGVVTCPLDVVNTRIKSGEFPPNHGIIRTHVDIIKLRGNENGGVSALFRGVMPRIGVIGIGSTAFWYFYAVFHRLVQ